MVGGGEQYKSEGEKVNYERDKRQQEIKTGSRKGMNKIQETKLGRKRRRGERKTNEGK
jgi:hypothetical protein